MRAGAAEMNPRLQNWVEFWDTDDNIIYVNKRHRDLHFRLIADHLADYVQRPDANVLDYGCGRALSADRLAAVCGGLVLCDAAPGVRKALAARYAADPKIRVQSPEEVAGFDAGTFDLIAMVSVAQYLNPAELDRLLALFRRLLKPTAFSERPLWGWCARCFRITANCAPRPA
jgi:SAM-dependent methyltransferase